MARETSVAIVGLGSRGLSVLERIIRLAELAGPEAGTVRVEVIDPTATGAGVHAAHQPDYLLLNTTSAQVSMFPDAHTVGEAAAEPGPNLYEWVTARGLRLAADGFTVGSVGRPIRPTDFLPRRVLGEYLAWFAERLLDSAPEHVRLRVYRAEAIDIDSEPDGFEPAASGARPPELRITLADGSSVITRYAFLTTGYTPNVRLAAQLRSIAEPYPLPGQLVEIGPGETVAVGGFGLSGMDVMSCLTVGRGGRFESDGDRLRYLPSGQEPRLLFYSRSGQPCRARPAVVEFGARYEPVVFSKDGVDALRTTRHGGLDFDRDVWPLIHTELRIAYRRCQARADGVQAEQALEQALAEASRGSDRGAAIETMLIDVDRRLGAFDPLTIFDGTHEMALDDSAGYQRWLAGTVREDLAEGARGFAGSLVKGTLDILRDLRDVFRHVVDFGGLTPESLERFHAITVPALNRAVVGPQYERHVELLALMQVGIVSAPFGPAPLVRYDPESSRWQVSSTRLAQPHTEQVDWLAAAWIQLPGVQSSASPLLNALYAKGLIRSHRPGSRWVVGIDINPDQHPINSHGRADGRLWVLGPLCEGATFYNNLVPSPATYSRPIYDAHRCVSAMYAADRELAAAGGTAPTMIPTPAR